MNDNFWEQLYSRKATCGACGGERLVTSFMKRDEDSQFRARPTESTDVFYCGCQNDYERDAT